MPQIHLRNFACPICTIKLSDYEGKNLTIDFRGESPRVESVEKMKPYSVIDNRYVTALLFLHDKLENLGVEWAIGGDLCEALRAIDVRPDCIEIITSREGVEGIFEAVKTLNPTQIVFLENALPRDAIVEGKTYPVHTRSHYFEFNIDGTKVKVHGNLQYRIDDWDWGDKLEFTSEYVSVVGKKIATVPLSVRYEVHQRLGWTDRAEKIKQLFETRRRIAHGRI